MGGRERGRREREGKEEEREGERGCEEGKERGRRGKSRSKYTHAWCKLKFLMSPDVLQYSQFPNKVLPQFWLNQLMPWLGFLTWNTGNGDWEWDLGLTWHVNPSHLRLHTYRVEIRVMTY